MKGGKSFVVGEIRERHHINKNPKIWRVSQKLTENRN